MAHEIAIIGDYFILPEVFEAEVRKACEGHDLNCRLRQEDWPNSPVVHGYEGGRGCNDQRVHRRF